MQAKIPIKIQPLFWAVAFFIGWLNSQELSAALIQMGIITVSLLVHEYGHALTAIFFGQRAHIELMGFGGVTYRSGKSLSPLKEFIVILNGPLAGLSLAFLSYLLLFVLPKAPGNLIRYMLQVFFFINVFWTFMNLLPIYPLDGGKLLGTFFEGVGGIKGRKFSFFLSSLFGFFLSAWLFLSQQFFLGMILTFFTFESFRALQSCWAVVKEDQDPHLQSLLSQAQEAVIEKEEEKAKECLITLRKLSQKGILFTKGTYLLASIYFSQKDLKRALQLLVDIRRDLDAAELRFFQEIAYLSREWKLAIEAGNASYHEIPNLQTALINAFCHARLGDKPATVGWLKSAKSLGLSSLEETLKREDFDLLRDEIQSNF